MHSVFINSIEHRIYNKHFVVSENGTLLRDLTPYTPCIRNDGYLAASSQVVHRMVAICWVPNPNNSKHVHHIDGNKQNNMASNLEWVTPKTHMSEKHLGQCGHYERTETTKQKLRDFRLGTTQLEETKSKISSSTKKHFQDPENFARYRESLKTRRQDSESIKKAQEATMTACEVNGIRYKSQKAASVALNMPWGTVRRRLFSKNFPAWVPNVC